MTKFEDATTNFKQWLVKEKVQILPKVDIKDYRDVNQGRGLVATQDIDTDEDLFKIPRTVLLNVENCTLIEHKPELREKLFSLDSWESLIIVLLYEVKVCNDGKWSPYFNVLPLIDDENYVYNQLMFWSDQELDCLKPSLIVERVGKDLASEMYNKLFPSVAIDELKLTELSNIKAEDFHKVASLIMSYSFDVEPSPLDEKHYSDNEEQESSEDEDENEDAEVICLKSMVPLADTLNADTHLHNASLFYTGDLLVMRSIKPIKKGEQIFNTYSDHPNSEILRRYGYVEPQGSKHDFGEIPIDTVKKFYVEKMTFTETLWNDVIHILKSITEKEQEEEDSIEIVLDSYDCFKNYPIIIEFIILLQILTVVASVNALEPIDLLNYDLKYQFFNRIYKKCVQLIESGTHTKLVAENVNSIIRMRMDEYPSHSKENLKTEYESDRRYLADVVLKSEYQSLSNCLNSPSFLSTEHGKFRVIADDKLIRNVVKKRPLAEHHKEEEPKTKKVNS